MRLKIKCTNDPGIIVASTTMLVLLSGSYWVLH